MSQMPTTVLAARIDRKIVLKLSGQVTAEYCPAVRAYCRDAFSEPPDAIAVDLRNVVYFDSTFLGTLLCLRSEVGEDSVVLISPGQECDACLRRMGAHLIFHIEEAALPDHPEWTNLTECVVERDAYDFQQNVVEAHLELARTPGPLQKVYEPIAREAEREFVQKHGWDSLSTVRLPRQRIARNEAGRSGP